MRVIYLAHPVSGDVENNLISAKRWIKYLEETETGIAIVASWITECEIWDDSDPQHREAGLLRDLAVLARCDELWLVGDQVSAGMQREWNHATTHGLKVVNMVGQDLPLWVQL